MFAIETNDLVKQFNNAKAVDNLCLRVPEGSIYGFLGPNGAGKTTTIKMLTGLSKPTSGSIKINNNEIRFGSLKNRSDIGYLPDVPYFYGWMTPKEYMEFAAEMIGMDKKNLQDKIDSLLDMVGLAGVKKKIKGFSRGMKQRLGIAQALISEPKVLFLDEPTSALDPIGRKEVMDIVAGLSGKITIFFSTHILSDVERVCDRVVILDKGKVLTEDTISNLREKYAINGIILDVEDNRINEMLETLSHLSWVKKASVTEDKEIKAYVRDMTTAQHEIPKIITERRILLKKFSILEPSLEDIFMKVVNE
ncbi:MAG: ABC transporter ATP-binding protein [Bacillota bacterium]|nr:ABC transporter ATP-binding protein [Bacillota bacterium]